MSVPSDRPTEKMLLSLALSTFQVSAEPSASYAAMVAMTVPTDVVSGTVKDWSLITGGLLTALDEEDSAEELDATFEDELLIELEDTTLEEERSFAALDEMPEEELLTDVLDVSALDEESAFTELDEMLEEELLIEELEDAVTEEEEDFAELDDDCESWELDEPSDADEGSVALDEAAEEEKDTAVADEDPAPDELVGMLAEELEVMAIEESPHAEAGISSGAVAEYSEQEIQSKAVMETAHNKMLFFILSLL